MKQGSVSTSFAAIGLAAFAVAAQAQTLNTPFAEDYTVTNLGSVPGLPSNYGGLTFLDSNTLLIGGAATLPTGSLYTIHVVRDAEQRITGFSGTTTRFGSAIGEYNDGGVTFGPGAYSSPRAGRLTDWGRRSPAALTKTRSSNWLHLEWRSLTQRWVLFQPVSAALA